MPYDDVMIMPLMIDAMIDMMMHMQSLLTARWPLALHQNTKNATSVTMASLLAL